MEALRTILTALPKNFPLPIVSVQHRDKSSDETFSQFLQQQCNLVIAEAHDKDIFQNGTVSVAPADYHLLVEDDHFCLSIDLLFESAARSKREGLIGIILTGANADGAHGLAAVKARGGYTIVQDPKGAEAPRMPEATIAACGVDRMVPLGKIAPIVKQLVFRRKGTGL